jgi:hypothetical protein
MSNQFDLRCPKCCRDDSIDILAAIWVRLTHDGTDPDLAHNGDHEWGDESHAICSSCNYRGPVSGFRTTPYMATFNTPAGWVTEIFHTTSPAKALRAAHKYSEGPSFSAEDLEPIAEGYCVREIVITDEHGQQHVVWQTDEYRLQLAAPKLLEALESVMHWWQSTAHTDDDEMPADIFDATHTAIAQAKGGAV